MDVTTLFYAAGALLSVLLLVVLAGRAARATGLLKLKTGARLQVIENLALDQRRRLLLVRCDNREVMLLTGPHVDLVIDGPLIRPSKPAE